MARKRQSDMPEDSGASPLSEEQQRLRQRCKEDVVFWINRFGYTYDPRERNPHRPFKLYPFQEKLAKTLVWQIRSGEDILIEKSRDMGVSWLVLLVFQWFWLFEPGSDFLIGSRKLDVVDHRGDSSSLFQRLRYNLERQPDWLLPHGFQKRLHDTMFKLINPENGNAITGESGNANFGRGGRYRAIFMDEFAYWQYDEMAYASAGQSSPCRIVVSTPHGRANKFAELRFTSPIRLETVHWRLHPKKDDAWYEHEKRRMTIDEVARELDINYNLSCRDRVFNEFTAHNIRSLEWNRFQSVLRSWDFGYHVPAVLFLQVDPFGRMLVLREEVGSRIQFKSFAEHIIEVSKKHFPDAIFEDYADPAGGQRSDKSELTNLEILNRLGIYPSVKSHTIFDEIEILRHAFSDVINDLPGIMVDESCKVTIAALEGGYRYTHDGNRVIQEHPYEDVMDCLRYAASHKMDLLGRRSRPHRAHLQSYPRDPYTGY